MSTKQSLLWWALLLVSGLDGARVFGAPVLPCDQVHAAAKIVRAQSLTVLDEEKKKAPSAFVIELVSAFRAFELQPKNRVLASGLLTKIPKNESQEEELSALDASICDDETLAEMKTLARVKYSFASLLARAVEIAPEYMKAFVNYSLIALNPHSDYAVQMQKVCRDRHQLFIRAVAELPEDKRQWFADEVLSPGSCRAIAVPEAD